MVLFMFVIMLLNLGHDYRRDLKGGGFAVLSFGVTGLVAGLLARELRASGTMSGPGGAEIDAAIAEHGALAVIADPLYTTYVVPFEITGILLLVAIVGALVLAKREV
jgi:NADH-quinone oxidoreductase subunit J